MPLLLPFLCYCKHMFQSLLRVHFQCILNRSIWFPSLPRKLISVWNPPRLHPMCTFCSLEIWCSFLPQQLIESDARSGYLELFCIFDRKHQGCVDVHFIWQVKFNDWQKTYCFFFKFFIRFCHRLYLVTRPACWGLFLEVNKQVYGHKPQP